MLSSVAINNVHKIAEKIKGQPCNIVITTHHKPDGDAMGSSLGLFHYLKKYHHKVIVMPPNDGGKYLHFLPGHDEVFFFEDNPEQGRKLLAQADFIFCLDYGQLSRVNEMGSIIAQSAATKVLIDHHIDPQPFSHYQLWDEHAAATCQLVYHFIETLEDTDKIDATIATCLYTGIVTDTGSFRYPATTPHLHRIVAKLMETGMKHHVVQEMLYSNSSLSRLQFIGYCLSNKLFLLPQYRTAYIVVSREELERFNIQTGETEGLVNYALSIEGVIFAALIIDRTVKVKLSFRSMGNFPANEFAAKYFKGGGHFNAAGGESEQDLETTVQRFITALSEYKHILCFSV
ncbi:MAG: bifunctional oligoribonuclease/PAP phosphatase NrnA [Bacteroidia bacterium]|nr:bifunctional oligoribonuclease/PAP phosphatase NrnA [Bacteroidia bacterium]MDW8301238.1 bifunctional oligoribonuclease/PAP phosphatase NrnA [Bacteroidia bacterium]